MAKKIIVLLNSYKLMAFEGDKLIFQFPHMPGDAKNPTPKGSYFINRKHRTYRSKKYNVQMNYAMFFTETGEAIHQYHGGFSIDTLIGLRTTFGGDAVGSAGCVRLDEANAKKLFEWAPMGTPVHVGATATEVPAFPNPEKDKESKKK